MVMVIHQTTFQIDLSLPKDVSFDMTGNKGWGGGQSNGSGDGDGSGVGAGVANGHGNLIKFGKGKGKGFGKEENHRLRLRRFGKHLQFWTLDLKTSFPKGNFKFDMNPESRKWDFLNY